MSQFPRENPCYIYMAAYGRPGADFGKRLARWLAGGCHVKPCALLKFYYSTVKSGCFRCQCRNFLTFASKCNQVEKDLTQLFNYQKRRPQKIWSKFSHLNRTSKLHFYKISICCEDTIDRLSSTDNNG